MNDEQAFLNAIIADPEDDVPRLVFADWLQEHGNDDRAEFIRVHCRLARTEEGNPEYPSLNRRSQELLAAHTDDWLDGFQDLTPESGFVLQFHRGFVGLAWVRDWGRFRLVADRVLSRHPVHRLSFPDHFQNWMDEFLAMPRLEQITDLRFHGVNPGSSRRDLCDSERTQGLRELRVSDNRSQLTGPAWVRLLAKLKPFPRLRALSFTPPGISANEVHRLLALEHWPELRELTLDLGSSAGHELTEGLRQPLSRSLRSLTLMMGERLSRWMPDLSGNPELPELRELGVSLWSTRADTLRAFLASPAFSRITHFHALGGFQEENSVAAVTDAPFWPNLERLELLRGQLGTPDMAQLRSADPPPRLRILRLPGSTFDRSPGSGLGDPEAIRLLADWPGLARVRVLDLSDNPFGDDGLRALLTSPHLGELSVLRVGNCEIGRSGLDDLAHSGLARQLSDLDLTAWPGFDRELIPERLIAAAGPELRWSLGHRYGAGIEDSE